MMRLECRANKPRRLIYLPAGALVLVTAEVRFHRRTPARGGGSAVSLPPNSNDCDKFSKLGCDRRHGLLGGIQPASGAKQWTHLAERLVSCVVNDRDKLITRQERRKLPVGDALCG
mmetsp:Transcript_59138/g.139206  ORF Transcript_59138/g.139206 Transcript_59138/m.139206 type:complete len:116 (+) Transcript_59138:4512-4859(+)